MNVCLVWDLGIGSTLANNKRTEGSIIVSRECKATLAS